VTSDEPLAILCYGDSNTWGYRASDDGRFGRWARWTGVLQHELGDGFHVIEEGLGGRTTMFDVPGQPDRNGLDPLPMLLESHGPLDAVVIALGVNDVFLPGITARWAARGIETLIGCVGASAAGRNAQTPPILVVVPPPIGPLPSADAADAPNARDESRRFGEEFRAVCEPLGVAVLDLDGICAPTPEDGIHFELDAHRAIGVAVAAAVRSLVAATEPAAPHS
jgi:lysophospholipase L1-like esterase